MPNQTVRGPAARADEAVTITINGRRVPPGARATLDLPVAKLYTHTPIAMPVQVVNGRHPGARLFVSAAIHGDEINGVEIIRRLLRVPALKRLRGTLIAVPIVNVHGFINRSRYLPDRRDLNRSFPGSEQGSLAARLADLFMSEIVQQCTHGIDLHTGAGHRMNLPQIRADLDDPQTKTLAEAFGVPVLINTTLRDGSLRQATADRGIPMLLYEAGEALRFDEVAIRAGVAGILRVMRALGMLSAAKGREPGGTKAMVARSSIWVRASESGILRLPVPIGTAVSKGSRLGVVADPFGEREEEIRSPTDGIVIARTHLPLVNEGDALFHIARVTEPDHAAARVEAFTELHLGEPLLEPPPP